MVSLHPGKAWKATLPQRINVPRLPAIGCFSGLVSPLLTSKGDSFPKVTYTRRRGSPRRTCTAAVEPGLEFGFDARGIIMCNLQIRPRGPPSVRAVIVVHDGLGPAKDVPLAETRVTADTGEPCPASPTPDTQRRRGTRSTDVPARRTCPQEPETTRLPNTAGKLRTEFFSFSSKDSDKNILRSSFVD